MFLPLTICLESGSSNRCPNLRSPTAPPARAHGYHHTPRLSRRVVSFDRHTRCPVFQRLSRPHICQRPQGPLQRRLPRCLSHRHRSRYRDLIQLLQRQREDHVVQPSRAIQPVAQSKDPQGRHYAKSFWLDTYTAFDLHLRQSRRFDGEIDPGRTVQAKSLQRRENHLRFHGHPGRGRD